MHLRFQSNGQVFEVRLEHQAGGYQAFIDGQPYSVEVLDTQPGQVSLRFAGQPVTLYWANDGAVKWVSHGGCTYRLEKPAPRSARATSGAPGGETVRAPMPAQVRAVQAAEGDRVEKGQTLLLLEAMKMEIRVKSPSAGLLARLLVASGQAVEKDQPLAEIRPLPEEKGTQ